MRELNAAAPDQPFFLYYVPGGTHSPHQPKPEWVDKFHGKFDMGFEKLRDAIFANQKRLGVIPANTQLTPWPAEPPKWDTLSALQKKLYERQAEVFAGYAAYTDYEIGRVIQAVQDMGKLDNTLIIYIDGDNGTSPEGGVYGTFNQLTAYNGILKLPEVVQLLPSEAGHRQDVSAHVGRMDVGVRYAVQVDEAGGVALRRHAAGARDLVAGSHHRRGRDPLAVPPRDRHRAHDPRGHRHPGARRGGRDQAAPHRRGEHALHLRQGERQRAVEAHDAVLRDGRATARSTTTAGSPPRRRSRRPGSWARATARPHDRLQVGAVRHRATTTPRTTISPRRMPAKLKEMQELFYRKRRSTRCSRWTTRPSFRLQTSRPSAVAGKTMFTYTGENSGIPVGNAPTSWTATSRSRRK